jgi:hypothetical protein
VPSHKGGWFLLVSAFNVGARRFYERHGYGLVGKLPGFALADVTELVLWKPADPCAATESGEGVDAR